MIRRTRIELCHRRRVDGPDDWWLSTGPFQQVKPMLTTEETLSEPQALGEVIRLIAREPVTVNWVGLGVNPTEEQVAAWAEARQREEVERAERNIESGKVRERP